MRNKNSRNNREVMKRILGCIRPYWFLVLLSLLLAVITVVLTLYIPILTGQAVDLIVGKGDVNFTGLLAVIRNIAVAIAGTAVAQWFMNHINNKITYHIVQDLRIRTFHHLQVLPLSYLDAHPAGDLISRVITDIDRRYVSALSGAG